MTREDIDLTLRTVGRGSGGDMGGPSELRLLALIVADQERRLRALEPCPRRGGIGAHIWVEDSAGIACNFCGVRR